MKLFNVVQKDAQTGEILIYGNIGEWDITAADFASEFKSLESQYPNINVRINSEGGAVFHGIAIFNTLRNSQSNVCIYIDGIAASMGAVISLCGKPLYMSRFARLMTHRVSGWASGDADKLHMQAEQMESLNNTLAEMIACRTGLTTDEVNNKYLQKGVDMWFTADQALALKLIDGIYDGVSIAVPADATPREIRSLFENRINFKPLNNENEMIKRFLKFTNLAGGATDEQIADALENRLNTAVQAERENANLKTKLEAHEQAEKTRKQNEVVNMTDEAINKGKILAKVRQNMIEKYAEDPDGLKIMLDAIPERQSIASQLNSLTPEIPVEGFAQMTWDELDKKNMLAQLKAADPELFKAKYKVRFGVEYK